MPEAQDDRPLGIFGGTFDPVHYGHLRLAEEAVDALDLAGIRWIPAGQPALRETPRVAAWQRLTMVRLAIADNPRFVLDTAEVEAARTSYTVPTLERLRQADQYGPRRPLVLLLGADAFAALPAWHRWPALYDLAHLAIAHRPGHPIDLGQLPAALAADWRKRFCDTPAALAESPCGRIASFATTQLAISATQIRALLAGRRSARYLLPDEVLAHLQQHRLYQEN